MSLGFPFFFVSRQLGASCMRAMSPLIFTQIIPGFGHWGMRGGKSRFFGKNAVGTRAAG